MQDQQQLKSGHQCEQTFPTIFPFLRKIMKNFKAQIIKSCRKLFLASTHQTKIRQSEFWVHRCFRRCIKLSLLQVGAKSTKFERSVPFPILDTRRIFDIRRPARRLSSSRKCVFCQGKICNEIYKLADFITCQLFRLPLYYTYSSSIVLCLFVQRANYP